MRILLCIATILVFSSIGLSQTTTGKIVGSVVTTDGVVPGATVIVTDNKTNKTKTATSSSDGTFEVSQLEFGNYSVKISANGFKTYIVNEVKIDIGQEYPLNARLEAGQIAEEVTITASGEQINSSNAELSTTISERQIKDLPLNGRNPLALVSLQAGANATSGAINGQRTSSINVTRDGLNVQDNFIRTNNFVDDRPTVDDTGEFTVTTQNAGADQGGGSVQIRLVTPRGGKNISGSLYEFNRNSLFTANSRLNNSRGTPKPFLNRNEFGGSLGGPLPLFNFGEGGPMFRKDKSFFFFNYEGLRLVQDVTVTGTTLLPESRNGTFTYTDTTTNTLRTVNVLTGEGLNLSTTQNRNTFAAAGGVLSVDPIIQNRILDRIPTTANGIRTGVNYLQTTSFLRRTPQTRNSFTTRVDYQASDFSSFSVVYRYLKNISGSSSNAGFSPTTFVDIGGPTHFSAIAWQYSPNSAFSNEVRGGFQFTNPVFDGKFLPSDYLIGGLPVTSPEANFFDQGRNPRYWNLQDNLVYSFGSHSIRAGVQFESYVFNTFNFAGTLPTYTIAATTNAQTPSLQRNMFQGNIDNTELARANTLRYFLGGIIGSASQTANLISKEEGYGFGPERKSINYEIYSAYVSDQWRLRPNLTLNIGTRYELYTPVNSPEALFLEPAIQNNDLITSIQDPNGFLQYVGGNSGTEGDFTKTDWDNLGGNISFAYSPGTQNGFLSRLIGRSTVLRGGLRVGYVNDEYGKAVQGLSAFNSGLGSITTRAVRNGTFDLKSALTPRNGFEPVPSVSTLPTFNAPPRAYSVNYALTPGTTIYGADPRLQLPRVFEYNIGIQREIGFKSVLEVRYVGNFSNQLVRTIDYNQIDINNNGFLEDFKRAQNNCRLQGAIVDPTAPNPLFACTDARYNPNIPGSQPLTVLTRLNPVQAINSFNANGSVNTAGQTNVAFIQQGRVGSIVNNALVANQAGSVVFHPQPFSFATEILTNQGKSNYNALQIEVRRRLSSGLDFQANYTFQKTLGDVVSDTNDDQNRQAPLQDNNNPRLNYGRPDYDRTHAFNFNGSYELPFGRGKRFFNDGWMGSVLGGLRFASIVQATSGPPLGVIDPRSTNSLTSRASRQSAQTTLSREEIRKLTGKFDTPNGVYFIDPKVLFAIASPINASSGLPVLRGFDLYQPLPAGYSLTSVRAASPISEAPFPGQVFFFNKAGETGNLPRNFLNGLPFINWTAQLEKVIRIGERRNLRLRVDAFNVINNQVYFYAADLNIDSNAFGRSTDSYNAPRVIQFGARFDF